jgi:hypothetical protein
MALRTLGTNATTSLQAFVVGFSDTIVADLAALSVAIRADLSGWSMGTGNVATDRPDHRAGHQRPRVNQAYIKNGVMVIPNRGRLVFASRRLRVLGRDCRLADRSVRGRRGGWPLHPHLRHHEPQSASGGPLRRDREAH